VAQSLKYEYGYESDAYEYDPYDDKLVWFMMTDYEPHAAQEAVHRSTARYRVVVAGRRSGKTRLASKEAELTLSQPNKRVWAVAPTYELADKVFREVYETYVIKFGADAVLKKSERERYIFFKNGSEFRAKSADNPDSLLGDGCDLVIFDECAKSVVRIWEKYLRPTLSDRQGRALFITTPEGTNWIYTLYMRGLDPNHKEWASFRFSTADNPHIKGEDIREAKQTLTDDHFGQEYEAKFTVFSGKVYKEFDITTHVLESLNGHRFVKYLYGVDFGFTNPACVLAIGVTHDDDFIVLDEVYESRLSDPDLIDRMNKFKDKYGGAKDGFADNNAPATLNAINEAGFYLEKARKVPGSVASGIKKVSELMKINGKGKPRLMIMHNCTSLISELNTYKYADRRGQQDSKEEPLKANDHACDALRYAVAGYLDQGSGFSTFKGRIN
jgi:PBSX family phage terminase large subunit